MQSEPLSSVHSGEGMSVQGPPDLLAEASSLMAIFQEHHLPGSQWNVNLVPTPGDTSHGICGLGF